jgi:hypothetical protein
MWEYPRRFSKILRQGRDANGATERPDPACAIVTATSSSFCMVK